MKKLEYKLITAGFEVRATPNWNKLLDKMGLEKANYKEFQDLILRFNPSKEAPNSNDVDAIWFDAKKKDVVFVLNNGKVAHKGKISRNTQELDRDLRG